MRCLHEMDSHEDSIFVTLTYSDEHIPEFQSLKKADLQKFFKRLRKRLGDRKIRYFACGEYGEQSQRPHYHCIIFGLSLDLDDVQLVIDSWPFCDWSVPAIRRQSFGLAEPDSISYVAQYIDKKYSGDKAEEEYYAKNRESVFKVASLGIGRDFCDLHVDTLRANGTINYRGSKVNLPRYYLKRLGLDPEEYKQKALDIERAEVLEITGVEKTYDEMYHEAKPAQVRSLQERVQASKKQHDLNLNARVNLKEKKL